MKMRWMGSLAAVLVGTAMHLAAQQSRPQLVPAQAVQAQPAEAPELTGIADIALRVSDLDREVDFFGKLGFEEAFAHQEADGRTLFVFIKINDREFIEVHPLIEGGNAAQPLGLMQICYETPDVKALYTKYAAAGLRPTPVKSMFDGNLEFSVQDPKGRTTEFLQYMPDSRPMKDQGQHLGERRISDELMGLELPAKNMAAVSNFYQALGFDAVQDGATVRLTLPANPDLRIVLHPAVTNDQAQILFPVDDARRTADELHSAGLKVQRDKKLVFVRDPDGNAFVLLETGDHSPRHLLPWHK